MSFADAGSNIFLRDEMPHIPHDILVRIIMLKSFSNVTGSFYLAIIFRAVLKC